VAVIALEGVVTFDLAVPCAVFGAPDVVTAHPPLYKLRVCAERRRTGARGRRARGVATADGFFIDAPFTLSSLGWADTVVVPGYTNFDRRVSPAVSRALRAAHGRGARVVSICTGAFALADAGLLDGSSAATHWAAAAQLAARYPRIAVDANALYVDNGSICTSAGVAAGIDLCLHLVRRDFGMKAANVIAKGMVVAPHRSGGQSQFAEAPIADVAQGGLEKTREYMLANLSRALPIRALARHASVSERTFARRFVAETGTTALQWLLAQRILLARRMLETTDESISRIAARTGFGTPATLRKHFGRSLGTPPLAYRESFRGAEG
jgi:transcriptional regulator GlxA family with amidase domain